MCTNAANWEFANLELYLLGDAAADTGGDSYATGSTLHDSVTAPPPMSDRELHAYNLALAKADPVGEPARRIARYRLTKCMNNLRTVEITRIRNKRNYDRNKERLAALLAADKRLDDLRLWGPVKVRDGRETVRCKCGSVIVTGSRAKHVVSNKHLKWLAAASQTKDRQTKPAHVRPLLPAAVL